MCGSRSVKVHLGWGSEGPDSPFCLHLGLAHLPKGRGPSWGVTASVLASEGAGKGTCVKRKGVLTPDSTDEPGGHCAR